MQLSARKIPCFDIQNTYSCQSAMASKISNPMVKENHTSRVNLEQNQSVKKNVQAAVDIG